MALIKFFEDPLDYFRPSLLSNQRFGLSLDDDDLLTSAAIVPRRLRRLLSSPYYRNWCSKQSGNDAGSLMSCGKDGFQVNLDVQQFAPEEITVKATGDNTITVEGKHEEKEDEHGYISRHFVRKYKLPKGHDVNQIASKLSSDGVLTITAPKIKTGEEESRTIPIQQTGVPSGILEKRKNDVEETSGVSQMDINEKESPRNKRKKTA